MTVPTTEALSALRVEAVPGDEEWKGDLEAPPTRMSRPVGVPLLNDGFFHYWLMPGETYRIEHDGTGWQVTARSFPPGHLYRLANRDGRYVDTLRVVGGDLHLHCGQAYELRETRPHAWVAVEVPPRSY